MDSMGTSSIYDGPVNPLLPDDYDDSLDHNNAPQPEENNDTPFEGEHQTSEKPENEEQNNKETPVRFPYRWKDAKGAMTNYVKGSSSDRGRVMNRYVGAAGGSKQLSRMSISGKSTAVGIGRTIQDFRNNGVESTLQSLQIDCVGKGAKAALSELINVLSGKSDSKEDIIARGAAGEAIAEMYKIVNENDGDIESLRHIDEATFRSILEVFMSEYIFRKVMSDLQSRFEKYENNPSEAIKKEQELKDYIKVKVELRMNNIQPETLDYRSNSIPDEIEKLFVKCYQAFEEYV